MRRGLFKKLGIAFGEGLEFGKRRKKIVAAEDLQKADLWVGVNQSKREARFDFKMSPWRLATIYFLLSALFLILIARAFDLQIIQGKVFLGKAKENHVRIQVEHAPRGVIYDRNGKVLAQNKPGFRLFLDRRSLQQSGVSSVIGELSSVLGIDAEQINQKVQNSDSDQVTIHSDLGADKALVIEAKKEQLPGVILEVNPIRFYPYGEIASHILGYSREADKKDLEKKIEVPYALGDKVGKAGVEQTFEQVLRGENGYKLLNISALGENKGEIYTSKSEPGDEVTLSIDIQLQEFAHKALQKRMKSVGAKGASVVVLDASTGEILALVSLPTYDNNIFSKELNENEYKRLVSNPDKLLINRALGAAYPPGSTFKMVTATAGLESGAIKPETKIEDPGFIKLGDQVFNNWLWLDKRRKEGAINVVRAIARSTDTFFYRLGQMIGEKIIQKYALGFGLGSKTGIELPAETAGLVPSEEWKLATKGEVWFPGETLNISIGQGDLLVSPLQLTKVTAAFANGGKLITPTILKTDKPNIEKIKFLKKETIETVRKGLYQDTVGDGNVGWLFGDFKIKTAGKTGTSEAGDKRPHAWYTAYAPHLPAGKAGPKAEIVATVMIEHAGHGSEEAAPVVKEIFKWWFANRK